MPAGLGRAKRLGQGGQSLAEFVLVLPLFVFLSFALLQSGICAYNYIVLRVAAHSAGRAWVAWQPIDEEQAQLKAESAARAIARWCLPRPDLELEITPGNSGGLLYPIMTYHGAGPGMWRAKLTAACPLVFPLPIGRRGRRGREITLRTQSALISENTLARAAR